MRVFEYILSPFIYFIEKVFQLSYNLTGNYGLSIILLSFAVSAILLPVFSIIEKAKKRDDAVRLRMKPLLDEIKRCYKGQERYYYIKTLNRQHGYNPIRALIPTLSLLLQIPFFIAAYQFLKDFVPLSGAGFLFISDLSQPDGLLGSINVLPIIMTLVNLLTAYFYTRNGNPAERKQMVVVAGIFLVLLFNLPSGLVLYWTMNNVFSFFRLFVTNPEVFRLKSQAQIDYNTIKADAKQIALKLRIPLVLLTSLAILAQVNWALKRTFDGFGVRVVLAIAVSFVAIGIVGLIMLVYKQMKSKFAKLEFKPEVFYSLLFFSIYFYFSGKFYFTGINNQLITLSILFLIPLQFIGIYSLITFCRQRKTFLTYLFLFAFFILYSIQLLISINYFNDKSVLLNISQVKIVVENSSLLSIASLGIIISLLSVPFYMVKNRPRKISYQKNHWWIFALSALYIFGLIFLWHPLLVFSSGVDTFDFAGIMILQNNYSLLLISLLVILLIFAAIPRKIKSVFSFLSLLIVIAVFVNSSLVPIDLGSLQESRFSEQENLAAPILYYVLEGVLLTLIFFSVYYLFNRKRLKPAILFLVLLNLIVIGHSSYKALKSEYFFTSKYSIDKEQDAVLPFSTKKPNIIFFIADGFQGWYIKQIMEEKFDIKKNFEGFTWFPNTISASNFTHSTLPAILCGHDYGVEWMNSKENLSIGEKITKTTELFLKQVNESGYVYSGNKIHYSRLGDEEYDNIIPDWDDSWLNLVDEKNLAGFHTIWFDRLYENAIFYSVPLALKPKIYNNTKWFSNFSIFTNGDNCKYSHHKYYSLRLLSNVSSSNSSEANFIFIHSHVPHKPWNIIQKNGKMRCDVTPYENNEWFIKEFSNWIEWMKRNGVYDNTKIILVSDHGPSWWQYDGNRDKLKENVIVDTTDINKIQPENFWILQPLLLVKDFNAKEPFSIDWRLMSNADASAIAFNPEYLSVIDSTDRELMTHYTKWESNMIDQNIMNLHFSFLVKNNIYDLRNWKRIE